MATIIEPEVITQQILLLRGQKVMIDRDLANMFGVETKHLNRQVRRNIKRFPPEFTFQLTENEKKEVVTNWHHLKAIRFSHTLPFVFTEHGVAMLATVLNSETAIAISINIIKAFIKLRQSIAQHNLLAKKIADLEQKFGKHDKEIRVILEALRQLMAPPPEIHKTPIGFHVK